MNEDNARFPRGFEARLFIIFGLAAPIVTFAIAVSGLQVEVKIVLVAAVAVLNTLLYFGSRNSFDPNDEHPLVTAPTSEGEAAVDRLAVLTEAVRLVDASSDQHEMFKQVTARVNEVFPFESALLLRPSATADSMVIFESSIDIKTPDDLRFESCLSGLSYLSGEIEIDGELEIESRVFGDIIPKDASSAFAIPLTYDGRVLAVFEIFTRQTSEGQANLLQDLEQIRQLITPLFLSAFASDRSISNALTDSVTEIPNERAFHMVLDNQLAESRRFRGERPLTVMAIDLKNFRIVNQQYGHATGDAVLSIAAARIRGQLRKMDFLSRFSDDEFIAVLPLVGEKFVDEVAERLRTSFQQSKFNVGDLELAIEVNIGTASFWQDGETSQQLIEHAKLVKQRVKAADPGKVVLFPQDYVN